MTVPGDFDMMGRAMDKGYTQALLYDFYGEMLTDRQKSIFEQVVFEDCSYGEAAENFGISRQSVHDTLKRTNTLLESYEEKLHLVSKLLDLKKKARTRMHLMKPGIRI